MATKAVEKKQSALLDLPHTPALDIGSEDMQLPRVKIGQFMSAAVQEQLVKPGSIYSTTGEDDPSPISLWDPKTKGEGVLFHVLDLRKGRSAMVDGQFERYAYNDPDAPAEAWVTYDYAVCLPEVDPEVPHKMLFTRTQTPCAKAINTVLAKNQARGPAYATAFRLTTVERENAKGKYFVPRATIVETTSLGLEAAAALAMAISSIPEQQATGDEPSI